MLYNFQLNTCFFFPSIYFSFRKQIKISSRSIIYICTSPVPQFHIENQRLLKRYRIQRPITYISNMTTQSGSCAVRLCNKRMLKEIMHTPRISIIIFCSCPKVRRETFTVYIDFLISFSPPVCY